MCKLNWRSILLILIAFLCLSSGCVSLTQTQSQSVSIPQTDTLTLYDASPLTLDPAISQDSGSHTYIMQIFSGLVSLDQDMKVVPDIAERWETETTADGTTYTFYLRSGVKFHDGREVTAADFKYSWERACRPATGSPTAITYLNDIVGVKEMLAGTADTIEGVEVVDDYTLRVTIDQPKAYFLAKLTYPVAFVVDKANVESGQEWWRKPNGTGPFKLEDWTQGQDLLLERNDLYYGDKAKVGHVAFLLSGSPMQMYEEGQIDVTGVYLSDLERVTDEANSLHKELTVFPELSLTYIGFDTTKPPFDNPKVRQAFCYAVDKERVISQVLKDSVSPAYGILPPGMPGYDENFQGLSYDLEKAKSLLAEAGYGNGTDLPVIIFNVPGEGGYVSTSLTAILYQWQQNLGAEIQIRQLESDAYYYRLDEEKDEAFFFGWIADYADPQNFLEILFRTGTANNMGQYSNPEVDSLLEQAAIEQDSNKRLDLYKQAEEKMVSDAACLPLWFGKNYVLVKPYVKGYSLSPLGIPLLVNVSVNK